MKRNLDEARLELKRTEEEAGKQTEKDAEHKRLVDEVSQLNLLRESNNMLRNDNEKHKEKIKVLTKELAEAKAREEPLQKNVKDIESKVAALTADKEALKKEVNNWKDRVQSLTSKYHQIDPTEHAEALAKAEKLEKDVANAKTEATNAKTLLQKTRTELVKSNKEKETLKKTLAAANKKAGGTDAASAKKLEDLKKEVRVVERGGTRSEAMKPAKYISANEITARRSSRPRPLNLLPPRRGSRSSGRSSGRTRISSKRRMQRSRL